MEPPKSLDPNHESQVGTVTLQVLPGSNPTCRSFEIVYTPAPISQAREYVRDAIVRANFLPGKVGDTRDVGLFSFKDDEHRRESMQSIAETFRGECAANNFSFGKTREAVKDERSFLPQRNFWFAVLKETCNMFEGGSSVAEDRQFYYLRWSSKRAVELGKPVLESEFAPTLTTLRPIIILLDNAPLLVDNSMWMRADADLSTTKVARYLWLLGRHMLRKTLVLYYTRVRKTVDAYELDPALEQKRHTFEMHVVSAAHGFLPLFDYYRYFELVTNAMRLAHSLQNSNEFVSFLDAVGEMVMCDFFHVLDTALNLTADCRECLMCLTPEYTERMIKMTRCACRFYCAECASKKPEVLEENCPHRCVPVERPASSGAARKL